MNEELSYAEMLEIPVETVTVTKRERRGRKDDLEERVVDEVNDRVADPLYAESKPIVREMAAEGRGKAARRVIIGEFVAVCALCAAIFLTNLFLPTSAINTFVRGLFQGEAAAADTRSYTDFALTSVVNDYEEVDLAVSESGILSFTAKCSVYAPCDGTVASLGGDKESGYTVELKHSDTFSTIVSGLDDVYFSVGESVKHNVPLAYSDGEGAVRVMFYSEGSLLNCYTLGENGIAWS